MSPYPVVFSPEASHHLQQLEKYLSHRFYPESTKRFIHRLTKACMALGNAPHQGTKRDDLRPGIRSTGFERKAVIYFKLNDEKVFIIGIRYGGSQFESEFEDSNE